jgi:SAM-dependent methyltransferase
MNIRDAAALIADAVPRQRGVWADLGAGEGTFSRALAARLEPGSRIYAVDHNPRAVVSLRRWGAKATVEVVVVQADFSRALDLPGLSADDLDGILFANSLHYVREPGPVLAELVRWVRPDGRVVIVEYDGRGPNRWVPYPIASTALPSLVRAAGLGPPRITARRPSAFGGTLYVAYADRLPAQA